MLTPCLVLTVCGRAVQDAHTIPHSATSSLSARLSLQHKLYSRESLLIQPGNSLLAREHHDTIACSPNTAHCDQRSELLHGEATQLGEHVQPGHRQHEAAGREASELMMSGMSTTSVCQPTHLLGSGSGSGNKHSLLPGEEALPAQDAVASGTRACPGPAHQDELQLVLLRGSRDLL